jgi:hypothetical protein
LILFIVNDILIDTKHTELKKHRKMKERKAFNFYRSYYEMVMELEDDSDKLDFLMALITKQFEDIEPSLKGMASFAYKSQRHSIDAQVEGYKNKIKNKPNQPPTQPPTEGGIEPPTYVSNDIIMTTEPPTEGGYLQEKEKEKGQEKEKGKEQAQLKEQDIEQEQLEIIMKKLNIK